jgi:hypothetical protein
MKYEKPTFYKNFREKDKYVGVRFKDPVTHFSGAWKCPKALVKTFIKIYDGVIFEKKYKKLQTRKTNVDSVYNHARLINEFYYKYLYEKYKVRMNKYKIERLLFVHNKYKLWKYFGVPMVTVDDFTEPKYFEEYKHKFNYYNRYKFKIW